MPPGYRPNRGNAAYLLTPESGAIVRHCLLIAAKLDAV